MQSLLADIGGDSVSSGDRSIFLVDEGLKNWLDYLLSLTGT